MNEIAYIGCNLYLKWNGVVDLGTNLPIDNATISFTITGVYAAGGGTISGTLTYVTGSEGNYSAIISGTQTQYFIAGNAYTAQLNITAPGGYNDPRTVVYTAQLRGAV